MTNDIDEYDDFREANMLISTTLKQLDEALTKGVPGSVYRLYSDSIHQSNMNGNEYERRSSTPQKNNNDLVSTGSFSRKDSYQNGNHDVNGNGINDNTLPAQSEVKLTTTYENSASTVSNLSNVKTSRLGWDATITNWINQTTKISPESSGSCSPESSGDAADSPLSDLIHSSSGLDEPVPQATTQVTASPPSPLGKLLQAIDENRLTSPIDADSKLKIIRWLNKNQENSSRSPSPSMSTVSCPEYPELQEKLHRLAMARDSLSLQVTVLNEQVGAQKDKIRNLESLLSSERKMFPYQNSETLNEAQKLDLINEINLLKAKYALLEKDKMTAERRLHMSQTEIDRLNQRMNQIMSQHNMPYPPASALTEQQSIEMEQLRITVQRLIADNEQKSIEINSLRNALDEHSRAIESYGMNSQRSSIGQPPPPPAPPNFNLNAQLRSLLVDDSKENIAHSNSFPASLSSQQSSAYGSMSARTPVHPSTSYTTSLSMASPQPSSWASSQSNTPRHLYHTTSLMAPSGSFGAIAGSPNFRSPSSPAARQLAAELDELRRINGELSLQQHNQNYSTNSLPRQLYPKSKSTLTLPRTKLSTGSSGATGSMTGEYGGRRVPSPAHSASTIHSQKEKSGSTNALNRWIHDKLLGGGKKKRRRGPPTTASTRPWKLAHVYDEYGSGGEAKSMPNKRSTSAPNLGPKGIHVLMNEEYYQSNYGCSDLEMESDDEMVRSAQPSLSASNGNFKRGRTRSTLRNLIGKLTRSTSQEIPADAFRRGGKARASAAARFGNLPVAPISGAVSIRPPVHQFVDWNTEQVCEWLSEIGFANYVPEAEHFIRSGRHLLNMTDGDLEKELLIKNSLHRKRLRCILDSIDKNAVGPSDRMDVHQVLLWLDLIGLPQLRDVFTENYIDGQMLLCLTAQDLIDMKITSALNHATLARGIQFLYSVDFHIHRIEKQFNPEVLQKCPIPNEVEKWAHGCVSHWLKSIDLAEFTPNLIFSGIHGALMVYEPTFTAESLAEVLQIPAHKTLLRRHLTTQFNNLIGQEVVSRKRETLAQPYVTFLSPLLRVKPLKKGFSLSRKKNKNEIYVDPSVPVFTPKTKQSQIIIPAQPLNTDI